MGDTEKRLVIFLVLSVAIIYFFTMINQPPPQAPLPETSPSTSESRRSTLADRRTPSGATGSTSFDGLAGEAFEPAQSVTIETPLYRAILSTEGGTLQHWELKRFTETAEGEKPVILYPPLDREPLQPPIALSLPEVPADLVRSVEREHFTV